MKAKEETNRGSKVEEKQKIMKDGQNPQNKE